MSENTQGSAKAWGGRFASTPDKRLEAFNASVGFDIRFAREDIRGSVAHVRMLGRQGIVSLDDASTIEAGLWQIWDQVELGEFQLELADEDIHTGVEARLRDLIGPVTGRLHTGRSRNDQVATDFRLWTKDALLRLIEGTLDLTAACLSVAANYPDAVMPGYTHLQRASRFSSRTTCTPMLLCSNAMSIVSGMRFVVLTCWCWDRRQWPGRPIRSIVNRWRPISDSRRFPRNSMDGVSDRDFVIDALAACSVLMMHISRLSEEIIFWSSGEAKYLTLSDAFSTGSSIMPQKKNADVAELARGKTGRVYGHLLGMLTVAKGLPLTYNKDFQEDKEGLFDAVDTCLMVLDVVPAHVDDCDLQCRQDGGRRDRRTFRWRLMSPTTLPGTACRSVRRTKWSANWWERAPRAASPSRI